VLGRKPDQVKIAVHWHWSIYICPELWAKTRYKPCYPIVEQRIRNEIVVKSKYQILQNVYLTFKIAVAHLYFVALTGKQKQQRYDP
jgi:hypothetical protein